MSAASYDLKFAVETIWKVGLASLVLGAGLPILFGVGIRSLAWGEGGTAEVGEGGAATGSARPNPLGKVIAALILLIVLYVVAAGIVYIVATGKGSNYDITFKHVIPEYYKKAS